MSPDNAERMRLAEDEARMKNWKRWGPYLAERQWAIVRENYSPEGTCWDYFPHEQTQSRAYRWGEDGLLGIFLFRYFDLGQYVTLEYIKTSQEKFHAIYQSHRFGVIAAYMGIYIAVTALFLPGAAVLTLAGGGLFTFFWVSQIGMLAGTLVYVNAGKELAKIESLSGILSPGILISFTVLGLFPITVTKLLALYNRLFGGFDQSIPQHSIRSRRHGIFRRLSKASFSLEK